MAVQKPTEADRRAFRSGFERAGVTAMRRWTTTLASNVTNIAPSTSFNASAGYTHELAMQQFNNVLAYCYLSIASATSVDIALQVASASGGPYHDLMRRSLTGGVATDVKDFDRLPATAGRYALHYAHLGGPFIRWQARRTGGSATTIVRISAQGTQEGGSH